MNVKELMTKLEKMDPESIVLVRNPYEPQPGDCTGPYHEADDVIQIRCKQADSITYDAGATRLTKLAKEFGFTRDTIISADDEESAPAVIVAFLWRGC